MKSGCLVIALLASTGCASLIDPGPDFVPVSSNPTAAEVYLDGRRVGRTPLTLEVHRKADAIVTVYHEGGSPPLSYWVPVVNNGAYFGNLLFGGVVGMIIDIAAQNAVKHSQTPLIFDLERQVVESDTPEPTEKVDPFVGDPLW